MEQNKDRQAGILAAMREIGGQIVDHKLKSFETLKAELNEKVREYEIEAGRHIATGLAYLNALGMSSNENAFLAILKSRHPHFSQGTAIVNNVELSANPIPSLAQRKQELQQLKGMTTGAHSRRHLVEKVIGPAIRAHR